SLSGAVLPAYFGSFPKPDGGRAGASHRVARPCAGATPHAPGPPMSDATDEITRLVRQWSQGDEGALQRLVELAYDDLRQIAHRHLRSAPADQTISTTVLVNELYMRLAGVTEANWGGRAQFFAFCSKAMRHILIDYARRH